MSPLFSLLSLAVLTLTVSSQEFVPNVPEECLKTGICEDLPDYPTEHVAAIIEELGPALDKYEVQELDASEMLSRAGDEDQGLCESKRRTLTPHAAPDMDGNWHYVLNQRSKPVQTIVVEVCSQADSACANVAHFYTGYTASCKQKFLYRNSPTLDAAGAMVERRLLFPSCCSCQYRQTGE